MAMTRKPCPGCNEPGKYRKVTEVCDDCKELIQEALDTRARLQKSKTLETVTLPHAWYALPSLNRIWDEPRDAIMKSIFAIIEIIGEPLINDHSKAITPLIDLPQDSSSLSNKAYKVPKGIQQAFLALYQGIITGAEKAFRDGEEKGQQLIIGLATGATSIDQFNRATIGDQLLQKAAGRRRRKNR